MRLIPAQSRGCGCSPNQKVIQRQEKEGIAQGNAKQAAQDQQQPGIDADRFKADDSDCDAKQHDARNALGEG
jgi:hypothetical protein